jgi:hypothetical protein
MKDAMGRAVQENKAEGHRFLNTTNVFTHRKKMEKSYDPALV